jgi:8-oxo-dGTP pyrophosphatase MutT (NUDIX family)
MEQPGVEKVTVSLPADKAAGIRAAAEEAGLSVSAWIVDALGDRLRHHYLGEFLAAYQAEFGVITPEEVAAAKAELGWGSDTSNARAGGGGGTAPEAGTQLGRRQGAA